MADTKLTALPPASALTGATGVYVVEGGNSEKTTVAELATASRQLAFSGAQVQINVSAVGEDHNPASAISAWSIEVFDEGDWWSPGSPSQMVVPAGVSYVVANVGVGYSGNSANSYGRVYIQNTTTGDAYYGPRVQDDADGNMFLAADALMAVSPGDVIEAILLVDNDDAVNLFGSSRFSVYAVG